jgi:CRISPR-associated protein Csb1
MTNKSESILEQMFNKDRVIIVAQLGLDNGYFLQPTGFPDIGSCVYTDADGNARCLIESEQSMANRLEAVCMKRPGHWVEELSALPVIEVRDNTGALLATNLTEPHRIASSYVLEGKVGTGKSDPDVRTIIMERIELTDGGASWSLDKREKLERAVFAIDPGALLHGFQFVQWEFVGLRQTRLLSARLECKLAQEADVHYGMVKFDAIEPGGQGKGTNKGQSLAAKSRVVAAKDGIEAVFDIDVIGLKSLALEDSEKQFLLGLALWKIGAFLANKPSFDARSRQTGPSLRLRADCYLSSGEIKWRGGRKHTEGIPLSVNDLISALPSRTPSFRELVVRDLSNKIETSNGEQSKATKNGQDEKKARLVYRVRYERKSSAITKVQAPPSPDTQPNEGGPQS